MNTQDERTEVIILTGDYRINGKISLAPGSRITDFILASEEFVVVTEAEVMNQDGNVMLTASFMNVNREKIVAIMPVGLAVKYR